MKNRGQKPFIFLAVGIEVKQMRNTLIALVLSLCLLGIPCAQALALLPEGAFIPCSAISWSGQEGAQVYYVRKGDTLWDISRAHKVDLGSLMALNHINERTTLKIGMKLKLPAGSARLHCIKPGESMWAIASSYQISTAELIKLNPEHNPGNLKIGANLRIPDRAAYRVAQADPSRSLALPAGALAWPVIGMITSGYGWRSSGFHHGVDIAAKVGTPIKACAGGKVIAAEYKPVYGRTVVIEHADGKQSLYAHAQKIYVKPGQKVVKGQVVATVGTTGRTTGPHLHLEIKQEGKTLNPLNYIRR